MKKISLILVLFFSILKADLLSLSAGVGFQEQKIGGYIKNGEKKNYFGDKGASLPNVGYLGLEDRYNPYVWVKFIYPLPLFPNIKATYTRYNTTGDSDYIVGGVKVFDDKKIPTAITNASTKQRIDSLDITLFYEFNPMIADIEIGGGLDIFKGHTKIYGKDPITQEEKEFLDSDWSVFLPYLYLNFESMSIENYSILATIKWIDIQDAHHYDLIGAIKYTFDIYGPINPFVKLGYKYKEAYAKDGDDETKLIYKGIFLEIGAKF
jgi:outer membrane protein